MAEIKEPWFKEGLRFKCTGCGKCCTGTPGYVFLSPAEISALANHLQLSEEDFLKNYTKRYDTQISLIDAPDSDACIFLKNNQCSVYEARPVQCRTFPWWIHNLRTPREWEQAAVRCEGINHEEAPLVPSLEIETQCIAYLDNLIEQNFSFD